MKQVLFILLFCVVYIEANLSQEDTTVFNGHYVNPPSPEPFRTLNMIAVDSGNIIFFYALNATDTSNPETYDDLQCLEIGSHLSKYYSYYIFKNDSLVSDWKEKTPNVQNNMIPRQLAYKGKFQVWSEYLYSEYFKDILKNELTEFARMPLDLEKYDARYSESIPVQNWVITNETQTVASYLCQKATCKFRGREYTVWFSMDIPISNGPWKFGGITRFNFEGT